MVFRIRSRLFRLFAAPLLLALAATGCTRSDVPEISLEKKTPIPAPMTSSANSGLRIGMGAMITPKEGYVYYNRLKEYLAKELKMPVTLVDRDNYAEMNSLLASGGVDIAFVCAGPYVEGHQQFGLELLAMPLVNGKPVYHSYIIVPKNSAAKNLDDLKGKSFAFTDPKSNTGKLVPTYMLVRRNTTPEEFFSKVSYTYGHDKSIAAVAEGLVEGAAVDSLIWEYLHRTKPSLTSRTRIIETSDPYGIPPLVVRKNLPAELKTRVLNSLLTMNNVPSGREILTGMMIDRFVPGDDRNYDSIRAINRWIDGQKLGKSK
ncbi:putative phosphite transport system-binding protein PtxB [Geobacter sp. OR-1]|uniref:substrate-binding domain-containing protein n=1 Tax=Geobacter sp. OR-1 TaxID=1266765 RepID=UPI00054391C5|nr:phosphate/phosphite/phosphonate ABC transporter substrate-binding protein [Geobacter sp. OR-1]GAM10850.1 putative phosphite transport system-binding protein PtxB [Geobacter sp. OR-1]